VAESEASTDAIKLLHDRVLVKGEGPDGERKSSGGIVIPATAKVAKRLAWAEVVAVGPSVRTVTKGDRVLFEPEERASVEIQGVEYLMILEREVHAVEGERDRDSGTGL
jgi:chaperonin GroES